MPSPALPQEGTVEVIIAEVKCLVEEFSDELVLSKGGTTWYAATDIKALLGEVDRLRESNEFLKEHAADLGSDALAFESELARYRELAGRVKDRDFEAIDALRSEQPRNGFELNRRAQLAHVRETLSDLRALKEGSGE